MPSDPTRILEAKYVIERRFAGAMGALYVARDRTTGDRFAIKTIRADLEGAEVQKRFQVEARAWIALGVHPHVAEAKFFREIDGHPFLFLEYVEGLDLQHLLEATGALPLAQAVEFARHILTGLVHAHGARVREGTVGVVHRDLKPANLLVRRDRVLKITDWGLVKVLGGTKHTTDGKMLGTLTYCAPEQVRDATRVDARADLFAVGAILFEMVAGSPPFKGASVEEVLRALLLDPSPDLCAANPDCPPALGDLVRDLLAKDPEQRPVSAAETLDRLAPITPPATPTPTCGRCGLLTRGPLSPCPLCTPPAAVQPEVAAGRPHEGDDLLLNLQRTVTTQGMVQVPPGPFRFGADGAPRSTAAYFIDRTPATNRQFAVFLRETSYRPAEPRDFLKHWRDGAPPSPLLDHPVVWVSAFDAAAFADWAGKALPTWEEWEKAARGTDGRAFPWGETLDPQRANVKEQGLGSTTPVERFPSGASPFGCLDMAGNVFQWTDSWREPDLRRTKVVCGGAWATPLTAAGLKRVRNLFPNARDFQTGFRCVLRSEA